MKGWHAPPPDGVVRSLQQGHAMTETPAAPSPDRIHPLEHTDRVVFLKPLVRGDNISVGDYTYYDDPDGPEHFQNRNVLYHFDFVGDRLEIGKFCALASGTTFIMNGANHRMSGPSTFPFPIFGGAWAAHMDLLSDLPTKGDTTVGHDVWFGFRSTTMPGVTTGHGPIVAANSVVTKDVPPFAVVGGNPAQVVGMRFDEETIARLLAVAWWDWPLEKLTRHVRAVMAADVAALEAAE
jgi:virginiamycin A acetyltransferase